MTVENTEAFVLLAIATIIAAAFVFGVHVGYTLGVG